MAESNVSLPSNHSSDSERVHERSREKFDEGKRNPHHHHKETHGLRDDIDLDTPIGDVKAPNVFERAREEIEAIVQAIHPKREYDTAENHGENSNPRHSAGKVESKPGGSDSHPEKNRKSPNFIEKVKEDIEAIVRKKKAATHHHHKETHGTSDDIDETTPINEVKGPNVFDRAKEEVEALLEAIHPKKDSGTGSAISSPKKEGGFRVSVGKGLEKICSPNSHNKD